MRSRRTRLGLRLGLAALSASLLACPQPAERDRPSPPPDEGGQPAAPRSGRAAVDAPSPPPPSSQGPARAPNPASSVDETTCCAQCLGAARSDPAGGSVDLVPCADFAHHHVNGQPALSSLCVAWFAAQPRFVQDCR